MPHNLKQLWRDHRMACSMFAIQNVRNWPNHGPHAYDSPGKAPADLLDRLEAFARNLGYEVEYLPEVGQGNALGLTAIGVHRFSGYVKKVIQLDRNMGFASMCRTFCHELGHAYLNETGRRDWLAGDVEEVAVEGAAALVTRALGFGQVDKFSPWRCVASGSPYDLEKVEPVSIEIARVLLAVTGNS